LRSVGVIILLAAVMAEAATTDGARLRVALIGGTEADGELQTLAAALANYPEFSTSIVRASKEPAPGLPAIVRDAHAVVFLRGPGTTVSLASVREIFESVAGVVLLAADPMAWPVGSPLAEILGATPSGVFAEGAPLSVINLFPHAVLTGVDRLGTNLAVLRHDKLADDAQLIIEGTVGESVTPLAWLRRRASGRLCHIALADAALFNDVSYQRLIANAVRWTSGRAIPGARPAIQRTFMPDSYPGAFAITFPNGPSVCLDPVRGGINYVWDGEFVDLRPRWLTKQGEPARPMGEIFYRERQWQPLRAGTPDGPEDFEFLGYAWEGGYPEFHYRVGGRDVRERLAASPDGGLIRRFHIGAGAAPLWIRLESQADAEVVVRGLERDGSAACFPSRERGEFAIEIRRRKGVSP
jgi:hypothetical protein